MPAIAQTILVLENDDSSRFVLRTVLERAGLTVLDTSHAAGAIEICRSHPEPIALLIADVVLREPTGPETIHDIRTLRPAMPILFVSGYPLEYLDNRGLVGEPGNQAGASFLQKPFTVEVLLGMVRNLTRGSDRQPDLI
jgi:two-component system, cell cycle sensor histidine kinase and response regulator CckA